MAFAPSTAVRLLNVPFERDYKNVLYYSSRAHQTETLMAMTVPGKVFKDFSYQRKDNCIKIPAHIDSLWNCNYCMYQNANYTDKWFYAFITHMEYVNDGLTKVYIETDVYNTWCFDINIKASFVEREHSKDDVIGENVIEENLETGEHICNYTYLDNRTGVNDMYIILAVTKNPNGDRVMGNQYGGVYSGIGYYAFDAGNDKVNEKVTEFVEKYDSDAAGEAIYSMFLFPKVFIGDKLAEDGGVPSQTGASVYNINLAVPYTLDTYEPRNNKLFTYPYQFLQLSNCQGGSATFKWERFMNFQEGVQFGVYGTVTPGGSIRCVPVRYNHINNRPSDPNYIGDMQCDDYGVNLGKFPICSWNTDVYTNWLTQNSINIAMDIVDTTIGAGAKIIQGGLNGAVAGPIGLGTGLITSSVGAVTDIGRIIGRDHAMSLIPPQLKGNLNSGDVMHAMGRNSFHFYYMSVTKEYAAIIDSYFDMFGYATHQVKVPEKCHRSRYWYTKTAGLNCDGAVPQEDMATFKSIYDNGVTFWRNPSEIENYSLSNTALGKYIY